MARQHNDSNVLVLGGRIIGPELAREIVKVWLETPFEGGRHERRLKKLKTIEERLRDGL
jgi:ribose 5-phosphate isomerase B